MDKNYLLVLIISPIDAFVFLFGKHFPAMGRHQEIFFFVSLATKVLFKYSHVV